MEEPRINDSCQRIKASNAVYPVPVAAVLWCDIPEEQVQQYLDESTEVYRGVIRHPKVKCIEHRCRAIHEAIEAGELPTCREKGEDIDERVEHVAPERRHVKGRHLREWLAKNHPSEKPAFLFDEIERNTHEAINADAYRALQADRDAARAELERTKARLADANSKMSELLNERDSLRAMVDRGGVPGDRAETTYLNIIGALVEVMLSKTPSGRPHSVFESQKTIIDMLLVHYKGKPGISERTLEEKFAKAKQHLAAN